MSGYICIKGLTLSGAQYEPGDPIPAEAVLPNRVRALVSQKYIAVQSETAVAGPEAPQERPTEPALIVIPLTRDGAVCEVEAAPVSIVAAACTLQLTAEEATEQIKAMDDETAIILIHALDSRKTVKAAAEARAKELEEAHEEVQEREDA